MTIEAPQTTATPTGAASVLDDGLEGFEAWWVEHGQYCRAGGGDYEKTFAFRAWQAATTVEREKWAQICDGFDAVNPHIGQAAEVARMMRSNDRVERPGAASGDRSARTMGCAADAQEDK